jgi:CRP-like cAMP-binding protein
VECLIESGDEPTCVRVLEKEDHFGEVALINNECRSLGIRVKSQQCMLQMLDRETFTRLLGSITHLLKMNYCSLMYTQTLSKLVPAQETNILDGLSPDGKIEEEVPNFNC